MLLSSSYSMYFPLTKVCFENPPNVGQNVEKLMKSYITHIELSANIKKILTHHTKFHFTLKIGENKQSRKAVFPKEQQNGILAPDIASCLSSNLEF